MITQHYGFAAASSGRGGDPQLWQVVHRGNPIADYAAAARHVTAAFARAEALQGSFDLPEISTMVAIPAAQAISFHFVDYVAHGWASAPDGTALDQVLAALGRSPGWRP
jgi:hypothetical protein